LPKKPHSLPRKSSRTPGVVFQPDTTIGIQAGVNQLLNAIRPTLGPLPRTVAIQPAVGGKTPELLDSGATIARRIIQIKNRDQDMGLMFARHMLWKLGEKTGDGTATAAVIFQELINRGVLYKVTGGNAMRLSHFLNQGMRIILAALEPQTVPLNEKRQLTGLAAGVCYDEEMATHLSDIFDTIGPYGRLEIRSSQTREMRHEYVQGVYWEGGPLSPEMILDKAEVRTVLLDGAVLVTDLEIQEPAEMIDLMQVALSAGIRQLLLVAGSVADKALAPVLDPRNRQAITVVVVKTPGTGIEAQVANLQDMALLTGGRPVVKATHMRPKDVRLEDFGFARRIHIYRQAFVITTGKGDPVLLRQHVEQLQRAYEAAADPDVADTLLDRLGHLMNGASTLWVSALTEGDYETRKEIALRAARSLRMALVEGVLPGGGTALLNCIPAVQAQLRQAEDPDEVAAYRMLEHALRAPFYTLLKNAGYDPGEVVAKMSSANPNVGFDVLSGELFNMLDAGIIDPALVVKEALRSAVAGAGLLLTTDVLIHKRNPEESFTTE
jgi:chaperonin GroEL